MPHVLSPLTAGFGPISEPGMALTEITNGLLLNNSIHVFSVIFSDSSAVFALSATPTSSKFYFLDFWISVFGSPVALLSPSSWAWEWLWLQVTENPLLTVTDTNDLFFLHARRFCIAAKIGLLAHWSRASIPKILSAFFSCLLLQYHTGIAVAPAITSTFKAGRTRQQPPCPCDLLLFHFLFYFIFSLPSFNSGRDLSFADFLTCFISQNWVTCWCLSQPWYIIWRPEKVFTSWDQGISTCDWNTSVLV